MNLWKQKKISLNNRVFKIFALNEKFQYLFPDIFLRETKTLDFTTKKQFVSLYISWKKFNFYFQVLLEFDKMSWKEREWYSVYEENAVLNSSSEVNILYIKVTNAIIRKKITGEKER